MYVRTFVQLGFLQKCLDWIYEHILSPVFDFISNLLGTLFKTLFENVLQPLLELQFKLAIEMILAVIQNFIYDLLYQITRTLLWVLDAVEKTFRLFGGLLPVYTRQSDGLVRESGSFLLTIFRNNYVLTALLGMIGASFVLCFLVSLIATAKSIFDMEEDERKRRTASKVLRLTANALLRLLLIPIMSIFMILLGDAILKSIDMATNPSQTSISNIVFTMGTLDAVRTQDYDDAPYYNSTTRAAALNGASQDVINDTSDFGLKDKYRKDFYEGAKLSNGTLLRDDITVVLKIFDIRRIDYIITIGGAILFIYVFGVMAVAMVSRAFDLILLLLVEPFFAAYMPLDDGAHFQKWQDTFLGRLVSCYGMVLSVNVYLGVIELIFSNKISFFGPGTTPGVVYLVNLIFVLAGAYTIIQAGPIITGIMSESGGTRELEAISAGTTLTKAVMSGATYPFRKIGGALLGMATERAVQGISDMFNSPGKPANPNRGQGDAFGQPGGSSPGMGSQFNGKKGGAAIPTNIPSVPTTKSGELPEKTPATKPETATFSGTKPADKQGTETTKSKAQNMGAIPGQEAKDQQKFDGKSKAEATAQTKDRTPAKPEDKKTGDKAIQDALGAQVLEGILDAQEQSQQGFDQSQLETEHFDYSFLAAGNTDAMNHGYVWIGQEAEKEAAQKKEMDELLQAEIDEVALLAAESDTGLDLNGDGVITGSKNDMTLSMQDIVAGESLSGVDLTSDSPLDTTFTDQSGKDKPLTMNDIVGSVQTEASDPLTSKPLSMNEIVSGESVSQVDLFADSPLETGSKGSFGSGTEFTASNPGDSNIINDTNALFETVNSSDSQSSDLNEYDLGGSYSLSDDENSFTEPSLDGFFNEDNTLSFHDVVGSSADMSIHDIVGSTEDISLDSLFEESGESISKKDTVKSLIDDEDDSL